jgi:hypothetical protein
VVSDINRFFLLNMGSAVIVPGEFRFMVLEDCVDVKVFLESVEWLRFCKRLAPGTLRSIKAA